MTGSTRKIIGSILIVLASLALLGGLGAAGYGYMDEQDNQDRFLSDPDRSDVNEVLMVYGAWSVGVGLVFLSIGIVLIVAGGSASERALAATASGQVPDKRRPWIAAGVVGVLLLAGFVGFLALGSQGDGSGSSGLFGDRDTGPEALDMVTYEGRVLDAYSTPVESRTLDSSESTQEFGAPAGAVRFEGNLSWTPQDGGTDRLRIILEMQSGEEWIELARVEGQGPLEFSASDEGMDDARLRFRVFPDADAAVVQEQAFQVTLRFHSGP